MDSRGVGRILTSALIVIIVILAGSTVILTSSRVQSTTNTVTIQNSSETEATITKTQTVFSLVTVTPEMTTASTNSSSIPAFLGADASPCYNSQGDYYAKNISEYAQCASSFLSLGYNESLNVSSFKIAPGAGYPFCFGGPSPCNCYGYPPCQYAGNPATYNSSEGQPVYNFGVYGFGAAYLVINYNATQDTSIKIFLDKIILETPPSSNSTLDGANWGYNGQLNGYRLYFPMDTLGGFDVVFLNNSTQEDSVTLSMEFVW
jgi:hypothetical protein